MPRPVGFAAERIGITFFPVLLILTLAQCGGDGAATGPSERPLFNLDPTGAPPFSETLAPAASNQDVGPIELGTYPYPTLGVVTVSGILEQRYSQSPGWNFPPPTGDLRGTLAGQTDAGGQHNGSTNQCHARVSVVFSQGGGEVFCDWWNQKPVSAVWSDTSVMRGLGTARWHRGPVSWASHCDGAGEPPCFTFAGAGHVVTVTPVPATLSLVPSRYVTHPGKSSVTFKAMRTPAMFGPHSVPFTVQSWVWTPDSGKASGPSSGTNPTCVFTPMSSGTMTVTALVNGTVQSRSVHIRVLCAATGRPDLDSLPLLDAMSAAYDSAWNANPADRRERAWSVDCVNGECITTIWPPAPGGSPCSTDWPPGSPIPGAVRVGDGHVHPFEPASSDTVPDACPRRPGVAYADSGGRTAVPGPSTQDYREGANVPWTGWNHCVVEPSRIYCFPVGVDPAVAEAATWDSPRQAAGCRIARAPARKTSLEELA